MCNMTIKYMNKKPFWNRKLYLRIYTLSKVTSLHTKYPYGDIVLHSIIRKLYLRQYIFLGRRGEAKLPVTPDSFSMQWWSIPP